MQKSEYVLTDSPLPADTRLGYGGDQFQFGDLRVPHGKGPFPTAMFVHGGFWRARYDLQHAGFLCAGLTKSGFVTWSVEYRRVGNPGGGWPGSFEDVSAAYQFLYQLATKHPIDAKRIVVIGHSAGGQLALALAAHHNSMQGAVSLAGLVNLRKAWELHLSNNAVAEFLGGPPDRVPEHYHEASPAELDIRCKQLIVHGVQDDTVPFDMSRDYVKQKRDKGENITPLELPNSGHYELIDPKSAAWPKIMDAIAQLV